MNKISKKGLFALVAAAAAILMILPAASAPTEGAMGEAGDKIVFGGSGYDILMSVVPVSDGYVAVGNSAQFSGGDWAGTGANGRGGSDGTIVKFKLDGSVEWAKNFGGSGEDNFLDVIEVSDGYVVFGYSNKFDKDWAKFGVKGKGASDGVIVKFNKDGTVAWAKNFGGSGNDRFVSAAAVPGGFVAVGQTDTIDKDWAAQGCKGKGGTDGAVVKFNNDGTLAWAKNFGGSASDYFDSVISVSDGFVVVGTSHGMTGDWAELGLMTKGNGDGVIVKFNNDGTAVWANNFGGSGNDQFYAVTAIPGGYIAAGQSIKMDGDWANYGLTLNGAYDATLVKFGLDGKAVWAKNFGGSKDDYFRSLATVPGGFIVSGFSNQPDGYWAANGISSKGGTDNIVMKLNGDGTAVWMNGFGGAGNDYFYGLAAIPGGCVAVGNSVAASFGTGDWTGIAGRGNTDATMVVFSDGIFVPVTNITGVPSSAKAGAELTLAGTIIPSDASSKTIVWSIKDAGTTGASISGNKLTTNSAGTVKITATVSKGTATGDFVKEFTIKVTETGESSDVGDSSLMLAVIAGVFAGVFIGAAVYLVKRKGSSKKGTK